MNKLNKIIYISIGIIILLVPLLLMPVLKGKSKQVVIEMDFRNPLTIQEVKLSKNKTKSFESFFSDYLPFRKNIITFWANLNDSIGVANDKDKVILGQNGYKFLGDDSEKYIEQYRNLFVFSDDDIINNIDRKYSLKEYFDEKNIGFIYVICPNKHHIYEEYMPNWATKAKGDNYLYSFNETIVNHELSNNYVFLADDLINKKLQYGDYLYYKTDSHWTDLGAFWGYNAIVDSINEQNNYDLQKVELNSYETQKSDGYELARNQGVNKKNIDFSLSVDYFPDNHPKAEFLTENPNWKTLKVTNNPKALNNMSIFVLKDSFYSAMEPYFVNTFTTVYDVHYNIEIAEDNPNYLINIIDEYNPDFVILETIARYTPYEIKIMPESLR